VANVLGHDAPSRAAEDVADKKNVQRNLNQTNDLVILSAAKDLRLLLIVLVHPLLTPFRVDLSSLFNVTARRVIVSELNFALRTNLKRRNSRWAPGLFFQIGIAANGTNKAHSIHLALGSFLEL